MTIGEVADELGMNVKELGILIDEEYMDPFMYGPVDHRLDHTQDI